MTQTNADPLHSAGVPSQRDLAVVAAWVLTMFTASTGLAALPASAPLGSAQFCADAGLAYRLAWGWNGAFSGGGGPDVMGAQAEWGRLYDEGHRLDDAAAEHRGKQPARRGRADFSHDGSL